MFNAPKRYNNEVSMPEFNSIFDEMFNSFFSNQDFIRSDVMVSDDNTLHVDVPGFNKENLDVNFYNGYLTIEGKNDYGREIKKKVRLTKFQKEPIDAKVEDGVLTLTFDNEASGKKKIELT